MKLLEVYRYREQDIYKFIHKSSCYKYFWYYRKVISKTQTPVIGPAYKKVVRKAI